MSRAVALAAGLLASVLTFTWFAGPLLETVFGIEALIVAYGAVAIATGVTTYVLLRRLDRRLADRVSSHGGSESGSQPSDTDVTVELEAAMLEEEVRKLKEE